MAKAMEKYHSEYYDPLKKKADNSHAQRQQQDAELIAAYNESADTAANTAAGKYRQSIDALPGQSQALYDQNAVTEAMNRKKIQERLANTGATNSGLNSSMQTALAVQKGNADRQVALQEQEARTQFLQAIDDMYAQTELAKKDYATSTHQATADWYRNLLTQIDATATQAASTAYAADVDYDAQLAAANLQKEADIETARIKAETERQNGFEDLVLAMYKQNEDGDMDRAMAQAVQLGYSTGNKDTDAQLLAYLDGINSGYGKYANIYAAAGGGEAGTTAMEDAAANAVIQLVDPLDLSVNGWNTFWSNQNGDGKLVADKVNQVLGGNASYAALPQWAKVLAVQRAVAKAVNDKWKAGSDNTDNVTRIEVACKQLGVDAQGALDVYTDMRYPGQGKDAYGR